jgi:xanthine dehydrogenase YagS FAD-binding subunit
VKPFAYVVAESAVAARERVAASEDARFFAGGTTLVDLMKAGVMAPRTLVDITHLPLDGIEERDGALRVGALASNAAVADDERVVRRAPALAMALAAGASGQLRNMATVGGNLLQRTRCTYYRDSSFACNRRDPGTGCAALGGITRSHAILGTSAHCIATHASDMAVALVALDAVVLVEGANGMRRVPIDALYRLPGDTPQDEHDLDRADLIVGVDVPTTAPAARSTYLKVRDRASYEFALVSAACALEIREGTIVGARIALGGVGTVPWHAHEAGRMLVGAPPERARFERAADAALASAQTTAHNAFKVRLAARAIVRALETLAAEDLR